MKKLLLVFTMLLLITACGNNIWEQELKEIDISIYTPRPATIRSYNFFGDDGQLLSNVELLTTYSDSQERLIVRENSYSTVYVEAYRVNKEELVLTSTTSLEGHNTHEKVVLTNRTKRWSHGQELGEEGFYEITGLNMRVDTSYGRFEDCIEVTHMVGGGYIQKSIMPHM